MPCLEVDWDLLEHVRREPGTELSFPRAVELHQTVVRNAYVVERYVATVPWPSAYSGLLDYARTIHAQLFDGIPIQFAGRFRLANEKAYFGAATKSREGVAAGEIETRLLRLADLVARRLGSFASCSLDDLRFAGACLIYGFLEVHPFVDGNGRTARYLFKALVHSTERFVLRPFDARDGSEEHARYVASLQHVDAIVDHDVRDNSDPHLDLADLLLTYLAERDDETIA